MAVAVFALGDAWTALGVAEGVNPFRDALSQLGVLYIVAVLVERSLEAGVLDDTARRECIDRIAAWNSEDPFTIGQHDVLSLSSDAEAGFLERPHRPEVVDTGNPRHGLYGDLDLAVHHASGVLDRHVQVLTDCLRDVRQGFLLGRPLGRTTR